MTDSNDALLLKVPAAARLLDISKDHCYELIAQGTLPHIRLGRLIRIPRHGLEEWIARQAGTSADSVPAAPGPWPGGQQH